MKGILFKPAMITTIATGGKTVTRRLDGLKVINQEPEKWQPNLWHLDAKGFRQWIFSHDDGKFYVIKPRYHAGETVYVKESYAVRCAGYTDGTGKDIVYKLSDPNYPYGWSSPLFMPQWAARYFLQILDVRPERLQEITEEDALAEGITKDSWEFNIAPYRSYIHKGVNAGRSIAVAAYMDLWDSINKEFKWSTNPWVWRYEFKVAT